MGINAVLRAFGFQGRVWEFACSEVQSSASKPLNVHKVPEACAGRSCTSTAALTKSLPMRRQWQHFSSGMGKVAFTNRTSDSQPFSIERLPNCAKKVWRMDMRAPKEIPRPPQKYKDYLFNNEGPVCRPALSTQVCAHTRGYRPGERQRVGGIQ